MQELSEEIGGQAPPDLSNGKYLVVESLYLYTARVEKLAQKLERPGALAYSKTYFHARKWEKELAGLATNIARVVGVLTYAKVREQGDAAIQAQQATIAFHTKIVELQKGLSQKIDSGSAALKDVVRELFGDVAQQLEERHQDMVQLSDQVHAALDAEAQSAEDLASVRKVVNEQLAALDAHQAINAKSLSDEDAELLRTDIREGLAELTAHNGANFDAVAVAVAEALAHADVSAAEAQAVRDTLEVTAQPRC